MLTHDACSLSSIRSRKPQQWTLRLCHVLTYLSFYLLGGTDNADPPTSPQIKPFPPKRVAENIHAVNHVLLSQFFPLPWESFQVSTSRTQGLSNSTNSSQSMSNEAFWTPNTASSQFVEQPELDSRSESSPN